tara:strand:+ start:177 stop:434 length:258 start_codon:yes stop_codon:yes gene_type:complete
MEIQTIKKIKELAAIDGNARPVWVRVLVLSFFDKDYALPVRRDLREEPLMMITSKAAKRGLRQAAEKGWVTHLEIEGDLVRFDLP